MSTEPETDEVMDQTVEEPVLDTTTKEGSINQNEDAEKENKEQNDNPSTQ